MYLDTEFPPILVPLSHAVFIYGEILGVKLLYGEIIGCGKAPFKQDCHTFWSRGKWGKQTFILMKIGWTSGNYRLLAHCFPWFLRKKFISVHLGRLDVTSGNLNLHTFPSPSSTSKSGYTWIRMWWSWGWSCLKLNEGVFPQGCTDSKRVSGDAALIQDHVSWDMKSPTKGEQVL